ncbi:autophagosome membrane docking [Balamuthia mandrillaris]
MRRQTNNNQGSLFSPSPSLSSASVWDDRPKPTFRKKTQRHQQQHDSSWSSFLPSSSSPTGQPFEDTLDTKQELEQRRIAKQDACLASSKRSLRMLEESLAVGAETLVELDRQGEQIRRCNDRMEEIHDNLNTSDRLIRGIGSWFGAFVNSVTSPPAKSSSGARSSQKSRHPSTTPSSSKHQKQQQLKEPTTTKQSGRRRSTSRGGREEVQEDSDQHSFDRFMEETDRDLDEMEEKLQGLQRLAMTMSDELQDQDGQLDKLSGNVERANERIRKNTLKVWKLT